MLLKARSQSRPISIGNDMSPNHIINQNKEANLFITGTDHSDNNKAEKKKQAIHRQIHLRKFSHGADKFLLDPKYYSQYIKEFSMIQKNAGQMVDDRKKYMDEEEKKNRDFLKTLKNKLKTQSIYTTVLKNNDNYDTKMKFTKNAQRIKIVNKIQYINSVLTNIKDKKHSKNLKYITGSPASILMSQENSLLNPISRKVKFPQAIVDAVKYDEIIQENKLEKINADKLIQNLKEIFSNFTEPDPKSIIYVRSKINKIYEEFSHTPGYIKLINYFLENAPQPKGYFHMLVQQSQKKNNEVNVYQPMPDASPEKNLAKGKNEISEEEKPFVVEKNLVKSSKENIISAPLLQMLRVYQMEPGQKIDPDSKNNYKIMASPKILSHFATPCKTPTHRYSVSQTTCVSPSSTKLFKEKSELDKARWLSFEQLEGSGMNSPVILSKILEKNLDFQHLKGNVQIEKEIVQHDPNDSKFTRPLTSPKSYGLTPYSLGHTYKSRVNVFHSSEYNKLSRTKYNSSLANEIFIRSRASSLQKIDELYDTQSKYNLFFNRFDDLCLDYQEKEKKDFKIIKKKFKKTNKIVDNAWKTLNHVDKRIENEIKSEIEAYDEDLKEIKLKILKK